MMDGTSLYSWRDRWFRWSVVALCASVLVAFGVGFLWLPSVQADYSAQGLWASICRAAGVPRSWADAPAASGSPGRTTQVVLSPAMSRAGSDDAAGRGSTLALQQCSMCHGAHGVAESNAPNLAGQYPEVIIKQLSDYRQRARENAFMQVMATALSARDIVDVAAYYATLPRLGSAPSTAPVATTALVRVGDPMRNVAPCATCHGDIDHKPGAPWLEGMPAAYLVAQLRGFASGSRSNDAHAQMRNMARKLSTAEIEALAAYYARR